MSLVNYQVPVWAVILGLVVLGEELPPQFLGALALILAGLAVSQLAGRARQPNRNRSRPASPGGTGGKRAVRGRDAAGGVVGWRAGRCSSSRCRAAGSSAFSWRWMRLVRRAAPKPFTGKAYVIDGDTIDVGQARVRLFGMDAPEMSQRGGYKAKSHMIALAGGKAGQRSAGRRRLLRPDRGARPAAAAWTSPGRWSSTASPAP